MCTITLGLSIVASYAWFAAGRPLAFGDSTNEANIIGGSDASYYESGSGTQADPYIISDKIHLYNLSWLQYIGYYNAFKSFNAAAADDIVQCYFSVSKDIDMGGLTIPPIGTEKYPFLGNFDGGNYTISNFTISNDDPTSAGSDYGIAKPQNFYAGEPSDVIGFFGVVGALPNQSITYDSSITSFKNFTLEDFTIKSRTNELLIGLAAGYVDGPISNVKIDGSATLDINGQTSTAKSSITSKLSDYGLVGYTTHTGSAGSYTQDLSEFYSNDEGSGSGGEGNDWGGSINFASYNNWIYSLYKSSLTDSKGNTYENSLMKTASNSNSTASNINEMNFTDFTLRFGTAYKTGPYGNYNNGYTKYNYFADPDLFNEPPDNHPVNTPSSGKPKSVVYQLKENCYLPLRFSDENRTATHEKNTGYIVGSNSPTYGTYSLVASPKLASYYYGAIGNSLQDSQWATGSAIAQTTLEYDDSKLEVLTYDTANSAWKRISDSHNGGNTTTNGAIKNYPKTDVASFNFEKYTDSRNTLQQICETSSRIHGIHFEDSEVSSSNILTVPSGVKINGETFNSNYQLLKGSIDFNLKKTGFINFFAGTYYTQTRTYNFFSIYDVKRSGGTITSVKRITKIYQNSHWDTSQVSNSLTNPKFFYQYTDGSFSNIVVSGVTRAATLADRDTSKGNNGLIFDVATALEANAVATNAVYYFEIPVNDGEYAMGMVPGKSASSYTGAYMFYLDIGANADTVDTDSIQARSITTQKAGNSYPVGVDFIPITVSGNGGDSIAVSIDSGEKGILVFAITSNDISVTDSSSVSQYAYRSAHYSPSNPSSTEFTCNLSGNPPAALSGGTRILTINLTTTDDTEHEIVITDYLIDNSGTFNESESTFVIDGATSNKASVVALSTEIDLVAFRSLTKVVTLTRTAGTGEFTTVYDLENSSYENKKIDVDLTLYGTTVSVGTITANYSFFVGGVQKYANNVIS